MVKYSFNKNYPPDKKRIANIGRYALVRGSYPKGFGDCECKYGLYTPGADLTPITDMGIVFTYDELVQLAEVLPRLIEAGTIRPETSKAEYEAFADAEKKAKEEAARQRRVW